MKGMVTSQTDMGSAFSTAEAVALANDCSQDKMLLYFLSRTTDKIPPKF